MSASQTLDYKHPHSWDPGTVPKTYASGGSDGLWGPIAWPGEEGDHVTRLVTSASESRIHPSPGLCHGAGLVRPRVADATNL
jgi:hypothetical protein